MTGLLRRQLGFNGLLITDAMDMNGVLARVTSAKAPAGSAAAGNYGTINNSIGIAEACKLALGAGMQSPTRAFAMSPMPVHS